MDHICTRPRPVVRRAIQLQVILNRLAYDFTPTKASVKPILASTDKKLRYDGNSNRFSCSLILLYRYRTHLTMHVLKPGGDVQRHKL
ncbi:hypothetical protein BRADI_3g36228v3 [Brachypodium distachyon]|uniref:Uncharacterized protein n=1 Tax=Brachypodium distachyon TaxID=15368 RepID=A0A2K2D1J5_BRADI|nr:hypothetical protein BRADI_3g36228v3 [Brachypodium distachyon]